MEWSGVLWSEVMRRPKATRCSNLLRMFIASTLAGSLSPLAAGALEAVDGFVASCTGNLDGTGQCVNQETSSRYTCLIIPGQVIDCKSRRSRSFQCVWISGIQANQAEFWCDPQVDAMLRDEISGNILQQQFQPTAPSTSSDPLRSHQNDQEVNTDSFSSPIKSTWPDPTQPSF